MSIAINLPILLSVHTAVCPLDEQSKIVCSLRSLAVESDLCLNLNGVITHIFLIFDSIKSFFVIGEKTNLPVPQSVHATVCSLDELLKTVQALCGLIWSVFDLEL